VLFNDDESKLRAESILKSKAHPTVENARTMLGDEEEDKDEGFESAEEDEYESAEETEENSGLQILKQRFPGEDLATLTRFLKARKNDTEKATDMLSQHIAWRSTHLPISRESILNELSKGKCYIRGKDNFGHPIIHYISRLQDPWKRNLNESVNMAIYTLFQAILKKWILMLIK